ncbi:MAG: hypothetical protein AAFP17_06165 [Pseudomonadota bacterium]
MRPVIATALYALLALPAAAGETAADAAGDATGDAATNRIGPAWQEAYEMQGMVFTAEQRAALLDLAWHAMAANICDELMLDHAKFGMALGALQHADGPDMSDEEHRYYEHHVAVSFGVAVGIMLAEHAKGPEETVGFCKDVKDEIATTDDPMEHHFAIETAGAE